MPFDYEISSDGRRVDTTATGRITIDEIKDIMSRLSRDRGTSDGFIEVVDFGQTTSIDASFHSVCSAMISAAKALRQEGKHKGTVLIGPSDFQFGMAKMFAAAASEFIRVDVVRSKEQAEELVASLISES